MFSGQKKIKLDADLYDKAKDLAEQKGYASVEELIAHLLETITAGAEGGGVRAGPVGGTCLPCRIRREVECLCRAFDVGLWMLALRTGIEPTSSGSTIRRSAVELPQQKEGNG